ncbi:hypothetical protein CWC02_13210 [Pseudoalteromonas sp. S2721]|uniref:DUF6795 domain-containing protein n=1 Tax=Pseudoalteromonas sp. S2721 TaxID=579526 RepID=UPI00110A3DEF|nr:DUF6795 domain-containing protein [Pseudoalteromonas sp. S2721]TMP16872.1 hypothetical protein CWC02_13210 [Pseudoalteromonas sp. S2721]
MLGLLKYKIELCPEVKGKLTKNGEPLVNQLIERCLTYEEEFIDSTYTDESDYFSFPAKYLKSRKPGSIFHEPVVRVIIDLERGGEVYLLWFGNQRGLKNTTEFKKHLSCLNADLNSTEKNHHFVNTDSQFYEKHNILSICNFSQI